MEAKIGNVTVSKKIFGSVAIFCNQQVVFVDALPTVNIRLNVLYAYNGTLQSWTGLSWVTYTGGSAGTHNDLTGRTAADQHPISAITGLQTVVDKVAGIDAGAQVNVIETVKVNGTALTPTAKAVDISVPTKLTATVTIAVADWSGGTTCTKSVTGVTELTTDQFYSIPESSRDKVIEFDIRASGQGSGTITFTADSTPDAEVTIIVRIEEI